MKKEKLFELIRVFPQSAGVYLMKNADGDFLYIGKALNLRSRVRSYFLDTHEDRFQIPFMLDKLSSIDWIATTNETEALILEANLIRTHKPPYNLELKDDKHFPYLKITVNEQFPRLYVVREIKKDGAKYFGPYTDVSSMRKIMDFAKKIFKIRNCKLKLPMKQKVRPCINYSIGRCSAPCANMIDAKNYNENVSLCIDFLRGKKNDVTVQLEKKMKDAAGMLEFEKAASLRDQIKLVSRVRYLQKVDLGSTTIDCDVFGIFETDRYIYLCILLFRQGLLLSKRHFNFKRKAWDSPFADLETIILQFYQTSLDDPPGEILLPGNCNFNQQLLSQWFEKHFIRKIVLHLPLKGQKKALVTMAEKNARLHSLQKVEAHGELYCQELAKILKLPVTPVVIEAFDISNLGDKFTVAGMVQFKNGIPNKSQYRRYKIKTVEGQNDFAMLMEAVDRRLTRLQNENKPFPDLLLIDGGQGQLSSVTKSLSVFKNPPMVISLAKKEEILYSSYTKAPVHLKQNHPVRRFVERIRNEVHRWAITYHRTIRDKQYKKSSLENLPGLGKKKARLLLVKFGSIKRVRNASPEDIASVKGFSVVSARKLLGVLSIISSKNNLSNKA